MVWLRNVLELEDEVGRLVSEAPELLTRLGRRERAVLADRVANAYVDALAGRALGYRGFAKLVRGGNAPEQALMKVFCSEARRAVSQVGIELSADRGLDVAPEGHPLGLECSWAELYFHSFASTIAAGSSEIQRNIIAERILGLPRG
jgi:alkylation response protein AidB-like acyl-CoA dehydrogenase